MKKIISIITFCIFAIVTNAQNVGIGTTTPNASAQLDVVSTTKGLLIPRMTGAQRNAIPAAAAGLMVIQTNTETLPPSSPGLYLREQVGPSLVWRRIARTDEITSGTSTWTVSGIDQYSNVEGNVGIGLSTNINEKLTVKGHVLFTYPPGGQSAVLSLMGNTNNQGRINFIRPDSSLIGAIYSWDLNDNMFLQQGSNTYQMVLAQNGNVGIGGPGPTEQLDVAGNIRSRDTIIADEDIEADDDIRAGGNIVATGLVSGSGLQTSGALTVGSNGAVLGNFTSNGNLTTNSNLSVGGTSLLTGDVTTNGDIIANNSGATLQLRNGSNVNKGFFQIAGDDVRFGTNSGNTLGDVYVRMNGENRFKFEESGRLTLLAENTPTINFATLGANKASLQLQGEHLKILAPGSELRLGNDMIVNDATGRVGIGTTTPDAKLHVVGTTRLQGTIEAYNSTLWVDTIATNIIYGIGAFSGGDVTNNGFAVGSGALAIGSGTCVIADATNDELPVNTPNRMVMRFNQGYRLFTKGDISVGVFMDQGDNSWSSISDSAKKENFKYADGKNFLQKIAGMRLGSWNYKTQDKKDFRHYGPMAQEFHANFGNDGIGKIGNDTTIATADIDGVMMIAIQALIKEKETLKNNHENQAAEINKLKENEKILLQRLEKIEAILSKNLTIATN